MTVRKHNVLLPKNKNNQTGKHVDVYDVMLVGPGAHYDVTAVHGHLYAATQRSNYVSDERVVDFRW